MPTNAPFSNFDAQPDAHNLNNVNCVENPPATAESDLENLDLKSLKNFFYNEDDETFLNDYLANYESDLRPETLSGYTDSGASRLPVRSEPNDDKPQTRSSLDDFIRNELVGVTENFDLSYELEAFELPPEANDRIGTAECPPMDTAESVCKPSKPRNAIKQKKLIHCNFCPYASFDKHKVGFVLFLVPNSFTNPFLFCRSNATIWPIQE